MNLADLDAVGTAELIAKGDLTAAEALEAAIARAEDINPSINAFTNIYYDRARAATPADGPLKGVPYLIKDLLDWKGAVTTLGSTAFRDNMAATQTPYMDASEASGAIVFAKTTTPEKGFMPSTESILSGPTRNPWNLDHTPGGSSGGAAAAVAARIAPMAHASDGGGSIRIPASCCGLFGFKPSRNRLVDDGMDAPVRLSAQHVVSRTVRDSAAMFAATERRGTDKAYEPIGRISAASTRRLKIGVAIDAVNGAPVHPEVRTAAENAAALCRDLGHETRDVALSLDAKEFARAFFYYWCGNAAAFVKLATDHLGRPPKPDELEPLTWGMREYFEGGPDGRFEEAIAQLQHADAIYHRLFDEIDVLLTPTLATPPPQIGHLDPTVDFEGLLQRQGAFAAFTQIQNVAGAAAMSVPLAMSSDGLPIGVHFAAGQGDDQKLFELAYELEAAQPWADRKPPVCA